MPHASFKKHNLVHSNNFRLGTILPYPMRKMTPTEQREAMKLLILLSHGNWQDGCPYSRARDLVVKVLGLTDERPLDVKKRKDALNQFLADGGIF